MFALERLLQVTYADHEMGAVIEGPREDNASEVQHAAHHVRELLKGCGVKP